MATSQAHSKQAELYGRLNLPTEGSIRLLDILPGVSREIRATLRSASLDSKTRYEALSYTWGASTLHQVVRINGDYQLAITDNLFNALRRLRHRFKSRTLWVDAICINQYDVAEKSNQIAMMGRIYREARTVDVWLGEPASLSPFTLKPFAGLEKLAAIFESLIRVSKYEDLGSNQDASRIHVGIQICWSLFRNQHVAINSALCKTWPRWYDRAWIIQEFVLAKKLIFHFGQHSLPYSRSLFKAMAWLLQTGDNTECVATLCEILHSRLGRMKEMFSVSALDVILAARFAAGCSASEPKDFVYSFLGLLIPREAHIFGSDYTATCAAV